MIKLEVKMNTLNFRYGPFLVGGFNPFMLVKMGSSSPRIDRDENKKYFKPPPSFFFVSLVQDDPNVYETLASRAVLIVGFGRSDSEIEIFIGGTLPK